LLAETHNATQSRLYQLPPELLFLIQEYLSNLEIMALRAASRKFLHTFEAPKANCSDTRKFREVVRRGKFREICQRERDGHLHASHCVCSICMTIHPKAFFSPSERTRAPERRTCLGTHGVIELCRHIRCNYSGLTIYPIDFVCNREHYSVSPSEHHSLSVYRDTSKNEVVVRSGLILLRVPANVPITQDEVALAMRKVHEPMCTHLRIDDPKCLQRRYADSAKLPVESRGRYRPWEGLFSARAHKCPNHACDTRFYLYRKRVKGEDGDFDELVLAIYRYLGSLQKPTDPKWIAQLVEPESFSHYSESRGEDAAPK
ncbi:hypothetical protein AOQ84DRAFT_417000, partial [Glonium stellatum]